VYQRLLAQDPIATNDLVEMYLERLVVWLGETNPRVPEDIRIEAAEDALLALIRNPESYSRELQTLDVYLRMSARGDLLNLLAKEGRSNEGRVSWKSVELSRDAGKYLGQDDDPSVPLRLAEEQQQIANVLPESVRARLSETDQQAIELILLGERRTARFAELYQLLHLPAKEQEREVKRHKDRLKKVLQRAGVKL
jgi:RNA polymerase sigma-70 factor (ECF subfamily)